MILNDWNTASSLYKVSSNSPSKIPHVHPHRPPKPGLEHRMFRFHHTQRASIPLLPGVAKNLTEQVYGISCPAARPEPKSASRGSVKCNVQSSGDPGNVVSGTAVSTAGRTEWQVVAHEIGHNFGAIIFIMSPVSSAGEVTFSPCSIGNIYDLDWKGIYFASPPELVLNRFVSQTVTQVLAETRRAATAVHASSRPTPSATQLRAPAAWIHANSPPAHNVQAFSRR
ncbi:reprolysin family zinc metalloprotease [Ceratobasidium sp. AG-Ba]|nr:reprolysin family zinc metalloprotease [Ceratobasidium sp. AG-Ba]